MLNGLDFAFGPSREIVVARDHATVYVCTKLCLQAADERRRKTKGPADAITAAATVCAWGNAKPRRCCGKERVKQ